MTARGSAAAARSSCARRSPRAVSTSLADSPLPEPLSPAAGSGPATPPPPPQSPPAVTGAAGSGPATPPPPGPRRGRWARVLQEGLDLALVATGLGLVLRDLALLGLGTMNGRTVSFLDSLLNCYEFRAQEVLAPLSTTKPSLARRSSLYHISASASKPTPPWPCAAVPPARPAPVHHWLMRCVRRALPLAAVARLPKPPRTCPGAGGYEQRS